MSHFTKKRFIVGIIILSIFGIGAFAYTSHKKRTKNPYLTETVKVMNLVQTVSASGSVKSTSEVLLSFEQNGKVSQLHVSEGGHVELGQVLVTLDQSSVASRRNDAAAALTAVHAEYDRLIAGASHEEREVAEVSLENARDALARSKEQSSADIARAEAEAALAAAHTSLDQSVLASLTAVQSSADTAEKKVRGSLNTLEEIFDTDDTFRDIFSIQNLQAENNAVASKQASDRAWAIFSLNLQSFRSEASEMSALREFPLLVRQMDSMRIAINTTSITLNDAVVSSSAPKTLTTYRNDVLNAWTDLNASIAGLNEALTALKGARNNGEASVQIKSTALASAHASLLNTRASIAKTISAAESEVKRAEAERNKITAPARQEERALAGAKIEQARSALATSQAAFDNTILKSPIAGTIIKVHTKIGEIVSPGQTVVRMLSANNLEVTMQAPEAEITKISLGDASDIMLDAYGDERTFPGSVTFINPAETLIEGVVYYDVTIAFAKYSEGIKPGMSADVVIHTDERVHTLAIPLRAIKEKNGGLSIEILHDDGSIEERNVVTSLRADGGLIELLEGAEEGEEIVVGMKKK